MIDPNKFAKSSVVSDWQDAIVKGTFLTFKHDVSSIGSGCTTYRTVSLLSQPELGQYLGSGNYDVRLYENNRQPTSPLYFEIVPTEAGFVVGSGIQPSSSVPTVSCNRFIVVSGVYQGWHLFAEQDSEIKKKQANGDLTYLTDL
jgi:hypothetical protein